MTCIVRRPAPSCSGNLFIAGLPLYLMSVITILACVTISVNNMQESQGRTHSLSGISPPFAALASAKSSIDSVEYPAVHRSQSIRPGFLPLYEVGNTATKLNQLQAISELSIPRKRLAPIWCEIPL
jgi:hypothetical protein